MLRISAAVLISMLTGCAGTPLLSELDNYSLCGELASNMPSSTGRRLGMGFLTFGISEIGEAMDKDDVVEIRQEMSARGLTGCSASALAGYDCRQIYRDETSSDYKTCLLTTTYSIESRFAADRAAADARRARAIASQANQKTKSNQRKQSKYVPQYKY